MRRYFPLSWPELLSIAGISSLAFTISKELFGNGMLSSGIAIATFLIITNVWAISRIWTREDTRFGIVNRVPGQPSSEINAWINATSDALYLTHLSHEIPSRTYTAHVLDLLTKGVSVVRIVERTAIEVPEVNQWLNEFRSHPRYTEYWIERGTFPFDFSLCDERRVIIYLSSHAQGREFNQALLFTNERISSLFRGIFNRLISSSELAHDNGAPARANDSRR